VFFSALELVEDSAKKYSFSAFLYFFKCANAHFGLRMSDFGDTLFRDSKPPLGAGCFVFSKGNLAVGIFLAETVQVFGEKSAVFQRKRRRDVCKNVFCILS